MMIGDVNGMILVHTPTGLPGLLNTLFRITKEKIIGMVMGSIRACASCGSSLITLPIAANNDA